MHSEGCGSWVEPVFAGLQDAHALGCATVVGTPLVAAHQLQAMAITALMQQDGIALLIAKAVIEAPGTPGQR